MVLPAWRKAVAAMLGALATLWGVGARGQTPPPLAPRADRQAVVGVDLAPLYVARDGGVAEAQFTLGTPLAVLEVQYLRVRVRTHSGREGWMYRAHLCLPAEWQLRAADKNVPKNVLLVDRRQEPAAAGAPPAQTRLDVPPGTAVWFSREMLGQFFLLGEGPVEAKKNVLYYLPDDGRRALALPMLACTEHIDGAADKPPAMQVGPTTAGPVNPVLATARHRAAIKVLLGREYQRALAYVDEAIGHHPGFSDAYNTRAVIHLALGQTALALADLNRAIRLDPTDPIAYGQRAMIYDVLGQAEKAAEDRALAARLPPLPAKKTIRALAPGEVPDKNSQVIQFPIPALRGPVKIGPPGFDKPVPLER